VRRNSNSIASTPRSALTCASGFATRAAKTRSSVVRANTLGLCPRPKDVFVIHGRNEAARQSMFTFLRAIGRNPIEMEPGVRVYRLTEPIHRRGARHGVQYGAGNRCSYDEG
jgi:hypothetical protein